jgi:hypothetical protein
MRFIIAMTTPTRILLAKDRLRGLCLVAMSFANDEETIHLAESYGAFRLLDKLELASTLIPAIMECTQQRSEAQIV